MKEKKYYCSRCSKGMTDKHNVTIVGMKVIFLKNTDSSFTNSSYKKHFGKYWDSKKVKKDGKLEFNFCYECLLDSLFGKG